MPLDASGLGCRVEHYVLHLGDRLFGDDAPDACGHRRWWARYVLVAIAVAALVILRRLDAVTNPQFFGEDGFLFFRDDILLGAQAITTPYMGFPYLGQRLIGFLGGLVPIPYTPRLYTTTAIAVTALGLATFSLPGFRHLVRSDVLRAFWCLAAACLPLGAGMSPELGSEVVSTPAYLGWWVAIWLSLISLVRLPRSRTGVASFALLGGLAVFTTPVAPVNAPLWLLRLWRGVRWGRPRDAFFAGSLLASLALLVLVSGRLGAHQGPLVEPIVADPLRIVRYVVDLVAYRLAVLVLPPDALTALHGMGPHADSIVAAVVMVLVMAGGVAGSASRAVLVVLALAVGSWLLATLGRLVMVHGSVTQFQGRYSVHPSALVLLAAVMVVDHVRRGGWRTVAAATLAAVLLLAWAPRFVLPPFADRNWPRWAAALEEKLASGSPAMLVIPMNPAFTPIRFDAPVRRCHRGGHRCSFRWSTACRARSTTRASWANAACGNRSGNTRGPSV